MIFDIDEYMIETEMKSSPVRVYDAQVPSNKEYAVKLKEYNTFKGFYVKKQGDNPHIITNDIFVMIDIIEVLKAYSGRRMDKHNNYVLGKGIEATVVETDTNFSMCLKFHNQTVYLDRTEAMLLSAKFGKVLQRCEAWHA